MANARPPVAKKKSVSAKKTQAAKKKTTTAAKTRNAQQKKTTTAKKAASASAKKPPAATKKTTPAKTTQAALTENIAKELQKVMGNGAHQTDIPVLPPNVMDDVLTQIKAAMQLFQDTAENNLTAAQRRRTIGPGVRNYGFIDKVSDIAATNPQYAQFFEIGDLKNCIRNIEVLRDLAILLQSFARAVTNTMLIYSTDASLMARDYYHTVQRQAQRGDPTAMELEKALRIFFHKSKSTIKEPSIMQTERDVHAILTHKKDGKVIVEGTGAKVKGGVTKVVDDVHKGKGMVKESGEEEFEE
jgi:hypothetical protein